GVGGAGRGASLAEGIDVAVIEDSTDDSSVNQSSYTNQNTQAKANTINASPVVTEAEDV
ncbi:hypothetical protein GBAR_LOCUS30593, partial [Geodia barretti]